jgi:glycosyltransferase involved in cell wall biosynthesis
MKPLLSVVIPTKERYEYLEKLVELLITFKENNFEIIIQDNSQDNSKFLSYLLKLNDHRVRYFYTKNPLSVVDNCDLAVNNSKGKFICFIGDDDGVLPSIIDCCNWMESQNVDAVYFNKANYVWPDLNGKYLISNNPGTLIIPLFTGKISAVIATEEFNAVLSYGGVDMLNLPRLYHGIVSREALNKVKANSGSYFPGPSPDMANAVALSKFLKKCFFIDLPLVISGKGVKSTSGQGAKHEHKGDLKAKSFLPKDTIQNWSTFVPKYWSGPTIWAESLLQSSKRSNISVAEKFNYAYLYSSCLVFTPEYKSIVNKKIEDYSSHFNLSRKLFKLKIAINIIHIYYRRLQSFTKNIMFKYNLLSHKKSKFNNVLTIIQAVSILNNKNINVKDIFLKNRS